MLFMMKKNLKTGFILLTTLIIFTGCEVTDPRDDVAPVVSSVYPTDGSIDIATDTSIVVTFEVPMDTASCEARFFAYEGNIKQMSHMSMHQRQSLDGTFSWNQDHTEMTFHPDGMFMDSTMYTFHLEVGMEDHEHGSMMMSGMSGMGTDTDDGVICAFETQNNNRQSDSAPQVLAVFPADASIDIATDTTIVITFDMPMDTVSCESRFYAYEGTMGQMGHMMMHQQNSLTGDFTWNMDHTEMTFHPDSTFSDSTMYTYHLEEGMEDHEHGSMMMSGMTGMGTDTDDGIICTFGTGQTSNGDMMNDNMGGM